MPIKYNKNPIAPKAKAGRKTNLKKCSFIKCGSSSLYYDYSTHRVIVYKFRPFQFYFCNTDKIIINKKFKI
ncbi:hypothetical protein BpHYR1_049554 [Brachionus plicatilis]|uniref:Uncharacterized protein n=1 Tax=Brachionus plicatilis TaxID=10195 RepID=A0A3M7SAQ2_BRAPC|nr:hypothetical protein BpHYR1_049554 [Brachionus plicatilis]